MSSLINKKIRANDVSLPKPHLQVSSPPLSDLEQRIKLISSKLDEGNVKGGIRLAASDDKIAPFSTDNYQKLLSKHPQRAKFAAPNPKKMDSFFVTNFDLYKAIMFFPNGSAAGPDKIVPQIFKDLVRKSNFLKSLTKLINYYLLNYCCFCSVDENHHLHRRCINPFPHLLASHLSRMNSDVN